MNRAKAVSIGLSRSISNPRVPSRDEISTHARVVPTHLKLVLYLGRVAVRNTPVVVWSGLKPVGEP